MTRKIKKIANWLISAGLVGLLIILIFPVEPIEGDVTVSADVSTTMVSCSTALTANEFGTIDNSSIYNATTSTTTAESSGAIYLKIHDTGNPATDTQPGLWKTPDLVASVTSTASTTLIAGTEGYGIQVATSSGDTLAINVRYDDYQLGANDIGGLAATSSNALVLASSSVAVSPSEIVDITYKAAVAIGTPGGSYQDVVFITCSATP